MESISSTATQDSVRKAVGETQRAASEVRADFDSVVGRSREAAKDIGEKAREAMNDMRASGKDLMDEYSGFASRSKVRLGRAAGRVSEYADDNTALVAVGALALGVAIGFLIRRR